MKNAFYQNVKFSKSIKYAINGLKLIVKNERNFRIILAFSVIVISFGLIFQISHFEWIAVFILISLVFVSESINSVIEAICDTVSLEFKVNIKYAKDVAAGAVLITAGCAIVVGLMVFLPHVLKLMQVQ